ncbi:MAG: hypothetical protein ACP5JN_04185, partial [Candidatus Micrarchaeia archaeon]
NTPPDFDVSINDAAFMSRWQFITFENNIKNKDLDLIQKLRKDIPKLYPWLLLIARKLEEQKNLTYPQDIDEIKAIYSATSARAIDKFITMYLQYDPNAKTKISDLYDAANRFCEENGFSEINQTEMGRKIKESFPVQVKQIGPNKERYYVGLKLLEKPLSQEEEVKIQKEEYIEKIYFYVTQFTEFFKSIKRMSFNNIINDIKNDIKEEDNGGYIYKYFEKTALTPLLDQAIANIASPEPEPEPEAEPEPAVEPEAPPEAQASLQAQPTPMDTPTQEIVQNNATERKTEPLQDYALVQAIHARINALFRALVKQNANSGIIAGEHYKDFSYITQLKDFVALPADAVSKELEKMLEVGDLIILPSSDGLFRIAPSPSYKAELLGDGQGPNVDGV